MLEHFEVLAGVRAALARETEAGQELLAQGRAQIQRDRQDISTQLLGTREELAGLHARLEAARQDVLQWVRGMGDGGCPRSPQAEGQQYRPQVCCTREVPNVVEVPSWAGTLCPELRMPKKQQLSLGRIHS